MSRVETSTMPGLRAWQIQRRNRLHRAVLRGFVMLTAATLGAAALPAAINPLAHLGLFERPETDAAQLARATDLARRLDARATTRIAPPALTATPLPPLPPPAMASADVRCLANAVFGDARGDNIEPQIAVAQVVLGHARRQGVGVCQAVAKAPKCFFPYTCLPAARPDAMRAQWLQALWVAEEVAAGRAHLRELEHAERYHSYLVGPDWKASMRRVRRIGGLIFYSTHSAPDADLSMAMARPKTPWDELAPMLWVDHELTERQSEVLSHTQALPQPAKPVVIRRTSASVSAGAPPPRDTFNPASIAAPQH